MLLMIPDAISRKYNGVLSRSFRDDNILLNFSAFCKLALKCVVRLEEVWNADRSLHIKCPCHFPISTRSAWLPISSYLTYWEVVDRSKWDISCSWYNNLSLWNIFVPDILKTFFRRQINFCRWKMERFFKIKWKSIFYVSYF